VVSDRIVQEAQSSVVDRVQDAIWQRVLPHLACRARALSELDHVLQAELDVTLLDLLWIDRQDHMLRRAGDGEDQPGFPIGDRSSTCPI
jgi:hypothetical protein